jgi:hypothetical protein
MPLRLADGLLAELPDGFAEAKGGGGLLLRSPAGEEIRITAAAVGEARPEARARIVRDRLVQGALKDVQREACQPDLEVVVPLARVPGAAGLESWHLVARSPAGRLLAQAVVATEGVVAVAVFEGRNARASIRAWFAFLESLRPA